MFPDIDWSQVTDFAAELANVAQGTQDAVLLFVNGYFDQDKFVNAADATDSTEFDTVRCLMAAHVATVLLRRGATGQVTSSSAGGLSRSFSTMLTPTGLGVTGYGSLLDGILSSKGNLRGTTT